MNGNQVGIEGGSGSGGGSGDHHDEDYSAIEILNDYAMESVLSFLPISDLKQCRLVNHLWNQSTLRGILAKPHTIVFPVIPDRRGNRQDNCKIEDIPKLIILIRKSFQFPWTKFKVDARILKSSSDKKALVGLFKVISPFVTELAIDNLFNQPLYPGRIDKQFETLKILKLHYCPSESVIPEERDLGFVFGLLEIAPCLDMLCLKGYQWIDHFLKVLGTSTGRKITRLYLSSVIEGKHLISLGELGLNLKYLCLDLRIMNFFKMNLDPENLRSFLESLNTSLEELDLKSGMVDITTSLITQVKVEFPRMNKLKILKICPASQYLKINFASQFPTLRKLEFTVGNPFLINMRSYFNLGMKPLETVQELVFHEDMTDPEIVVLAGRVSGKEVET